MTLFALEALLRPFSKWKDRRAPTVFAVISGAYSLVVAAGLVHFGLAFRYPEQFDAEPHVRVREEIARLSGERPGAPEVKELMEEYRAEDARLRREYLTANAKLRSGGWMLLAGLAVFALSMRRLAHLREELPAPAPRRAPAELARDRKRSAFAATTVSLCASAAVLFAILWVRRAAEPSGPVEEVAEAAPTEADVPDNLKWPMFRGPTGLGYAPEGTYPTSWDAVAGENIVWRTKVPLPGKSSPIVWGSRVFLTGADRSTRAVFAFDRETGRLLWTCRVRTPASSLKIGEVPEDSGLAMPTPATDGLRVYALFGTNELAAVDMAGRQAWSRWFGEPDSPYGIATSLVIYGGKLYLQLDQGLKDEEHSFLYALDPATGETLWEVPRTVPASWSSPVIIDTGQRLELITAAAPWVIAYEPGSGKELWRAKVLSGDVAPSPAYAHGVVFTLTEYSQLAATKTGGSGDVTKTNVLWTYDEELSSTGSPVAGDSPEGPLLIQASNYDNIVCHDAKTGKVLWTVELDERAWASPVLAGELVYLTEAEGRTFIFPLAGKYEERGRGSVGEEVLATPAFAGDRIYLRGKDHLFCVGASPVRDKGEDGAENR